MISRCDCVKIAKLPACLFSQSVRKMMNQDLLDRRMEFKLDPVSAPLICECTYLKVPNGSRGFLLFFPVSERLRHKSPRNCMLG